MRLWLCGVLALVLLGCSVPQETRGARLLQELNDRGFGKRYEGDINEEYYLGVGDTISVLEVTNPQLTLPPLTVAANGTIAVPVVGRVHVGGLTLPEVENVLTEKLGRYYHNLNLHVSLAGGRSKRIYLFGQTLRKGALPLPGDLTILELMAEARLSPLGNPAGIYIIRGDPKEPLIINVNLREIIETGNTLKNVTVKDNDIIYVEPTYIGYLVLTVQRLLTPLRSLVLAGQGLQIAAYLESQLENFDEFGDRPLFVGGRGGRRGGAFFQEYDQ